jgi:hypothetical protein
MPQWAAWLLFLLTLGGAFEWQFFRIYFLDLQELQSEFRSFPDTPYPLFPAYLHEVRSRVPVNASVALVMPARTWDDGYAYGYYRASYLLAGRRVIPLVSPDNSLHLEKLHDADYVAVWRMELDSPEFQPVWNGFEGRLLKRMR